MMSYTPCSVVPNDACRRRAFSATRCSWVPEKNAPAISAPTTTSATMAMASAIPRSFFRTCLIPVSLVYMSLSCSRQSARHDRERPGSAARVVAQRDPRGHAVDLVRLYLGPSPDGGRGAGAQRDLDLRHLGRVRGDRPVAVEVAERDAIGSDERADDRLHHPARRVVLLAKVP